MKRVEETKGTIITVLILKLTIRKLITIIIIIIPREN